MGLEDRNEEAEDKEDIDKLVQEREEARKAKDYAKADAIRDKLKAMGIVIKDTSTGAVWERES